MNDKIVEKALDVFDEYINPAPEGVDLYNSKGRKAMQLKMKHFIDNNIPIQFVFPGFPAKSANITDKVLGTLPDGAEEVSFLQFRDFANSINEVYKPGVDICVVSDGYVFNDLVKIPDENVDAYEKECRTMIKELPITWHTVFDFYKNASKKELMSSMMGEFAISEKLLDEKIREDPDTHILYCGMHRFMQLDISWPKEWTKNKIKKSAKPIAKDMIRRSEAYTGLIKKQFPNSIRLSCHPSTNEGTKYSWQFVPGSSVASPWHNTLCINDDGTYSLRKRMEAVSQGLELIEERGRPYFFRSPGTNVGIKR